MRSRHRLGLPKRRRASRCASRVGHALLDIPLLAHGEVELEFFLVLPCQFFLSKDCAKTRDHAMKSHLSRCGPKIQYQRHRVVIFCQFSRSA